MDDAHKYRQEQRQLDDIEEVEELPLILQVHLLDEFVPDVFISGKAEAPQPIGIGARIVDLNSRLGLAAEGLRWRAQKVGVSSLRTAGNTDALAHGLL